MKIKTIDKKEQMSNLDDEEELLMQTEMKGMNE